MVHCPGLGEGKQPGIVRALGVLSDQEVHCLLGNENLPDGVLCFWASDHEITCFILRGLFADGDSSVICVKGFPPQRYRCSLADAADQLRIERGQGTPFLRCGQMSS